MENNKQTTGLPENATRELRPGEKYTPMLSPNKTYPEVNLWSVSLGLSPPNKLREELIDCSDKELRR